jgi:cytochrome c oxidase assembly factor CtaG
MKRKRNRRRNKPWIILRRFCMVTQTLITYATTGSGFAGTHR